MANNAPVGDSSQKTNDSLQIKDSSQQTQGSTLTPLSDLEEALKDVIDPEIGVNIVDLGLVYELDYAKDGTLFVSMTLTSAACPLQDMIEEQIAAILNPLVDDYQINWVWMPPWGMERITDDGKEQMRAIGFNI